MKTMMMVLLGAVLIIFLAFVNLVAAICVNYNQFGILTTIAQVGQFIVNAVYLLGGAAAVVWLSARQARTIQKSLHDSGLYEPLQAAEAPIDTASIGDPKAGWYIVNQHPQPEVDTEPLEPVRPTPSVQPVYKPFVKAVYTNVKPDPAKQPPYTVRRS
jgi:hypothetical protein